MKSATTSIASAALLGVLACGGSPEPSAVENTSEEFAVKELVADFAGELEAGRIQGLLSLLDPAFLHQGEDLARVEAWARQVASSGEALRVEVDSIDVVVAADPGERLPDGATALASYTLRVSSCDVEQNCERLYDQRAVPGAPQAWLSHLRKQEGRWVPVGDGLPFGLAATSRHEDGRFFTDARVRDLRGRVRGGRLLGRGAEGGVALGLAPSGDWAPTAEVLLANGPGELPALPLSYTLELDTVDGPASFEVQVRAVVQELATPAEPLGAARPPFVFRFGAPEGRFRRYQVRVLGDAGPLWVSAPTYETTVPYEGPTLPSGIERPYELVVLDEHGDVSVATGSFVPFGAEEGTPALHAVAPASGPAAGGQLVALEGENFEPGLRVLFGEVEATEVVVQGPGEAQCRTPAREPGVVDVTVVNPSGRFATSAAGYTYLP